MAGVATGAALTVLLFCGCVGTLVAGLGQLTRRADQHRDGRSHLQAACLDLEERLNRLVPPGSTTAPDRRAAAIRDENAAVQPFLTELERQPGGWRAHDRRGGGWRDGDPRGGPAAGWRSLLEARSSYANALDRQVTTGQPAFFATELDRHGRPVFDWLQYGPEGCAGPARRLTVPDL